MSGLYATSDHWQLYVHCSEMFPSIDLATETNNSIGQMYLIEMLTERMPLYYEHVIIHFLNLNNVVVLRLCERYTLNSFYRDLIT